jgi:transposase-like protein
LAYTRCIIAGIISIAKYSELLAGKSVRLRPSHCLNCNSCNIHFHALYFRKARRGSAKLNPVPIQRYQCKDCGRTFSVLPECIAPRRWYAWSDQQAVLEIAITETSRPSLQKMSQDHGISRRTIARWIRWLIERYDLFSAILKTRYSELGYASHAKLFWRICFQNIGLSAAMVMVNWLGESVP